MIWFDTVDPSVALPQHEENQADAQQIYFFHKIHHKLCDLDRTFK